MTFSAVIHCDPESFTWRVAGLRLLDRLVVALHRAGAESIVAVTVTPLPFLRRADAFGIRVRNQESEIQTGNQTPGVGSPGVFQGSGPVLLVSSRLLVQAKDVLQLVEQGGRLVSREGQLLPIGLVPQFSNQPIEEALAPLPHVVAQGVTAVVSDEKSTALAVRKLWASLGSSEDGWVDRYFNRPLGRFLSKALVYTDVTPNQVSVVAIMIGLVAAYFFSRGGYNAVVWGAILLQISAIVDCVDGELARVLFRESAVGKWLDIVGDQVVHISVFAGIGWGLYRTASSDPVLLLGASAVIGVIISFGVVMFGRFQAEARRNVRLQRWIDATTNRDFSVVLLILAVLGKLPWFLWMTAIGVHVFWLAALGVQLLGAPDPVLKLDRESHS